MPPKISSTFRIDEDALAVAGGLREILEAAQEKATTEMRRRDELRFVWSIMEALGVDNITIPHSVRCRAVPEISWRVDPTTGDLVISRNTI